VGGGRVLKGNCASGDFPLFTKVRAIKSKALGQIESSRRNFEFSWAVGVGGGF